MRKFPATAIRHAALLALSCFLFLLSKGQVTITTLPNPPYNGGNSLGAPAQVSFVIENTNSSGFFLTGISNWCNTGNNGSVWELYFTSSALSGTSTDVTTSPWTLVATSSPTTVTGTGITPLNFPGLNFFIPGNTQYRFALRNTGPGSTFYSGTTAMTPNTFSNSGINLLLGDVQIAGQPVGYSGTGTSLTITPRYFTGEVVLIPATACAGTPIPGTAQASVSSVCSPTQSFTISVNGATVGSGLTYQWESSLSATGPWTVISGATTANLTVPGVSTTSYYRRRINCGSNSAISTSVQVSVNPVSYAPLPYNESFEANWINACDVADAPNNFWRNTPATGNASWRRNDDGVSGGWTAPASWAYTPVSTDGSFSARFHSGEVTGRATNNFDLFVNASSGSATKRLQFDFINTSGTDSLTIFISNDGGTTFTRVDTAFLATAWRTKTVIFNSTSPTTVIRFRATGDFGVTDIGVDRLSIVSLPLCTGTPAGGTVSPASLGVCGNTPINFTVAGSVDPTTVGGISFQWQQSTDGGATWTNITGATGESYVSPGVLVPTRFRRQTSCNGTGTTNSTEANITLAAVSYAAIPYTESFETTWSSVCANRDVPNNFWRNTPATTDSSWRRNDDGVASGAWGNDLGAYTPAASAGSFSARFHTWPITSGRSGRFDLHINAATASPVKRLSFDFINTSGNDSLVVLISTNGGASFVRLDSVRNAVNWRTKQIVFTSTSATTVIRFQATSDFGTTDIGLDNVSIIDFPNCSGTPTGGTTASSASNVCPNVPFSLSVTGATDANGITFQWQASTDGGTTWTNVPAATGATFNVAGIIASTQYRRQIFCGTNSSISTPITITINAPSYATLPFAESFEATWINGCGISDIPNNFWRNTPITTDSSWRRDDDAPTSNTANWTSPTLGAYSPDASDGDYSARFHSRNVTSGRRGRLDLYLNAATSSPVKRLRYDFINASGNDSLVILVSTNNGATFTRIDSATLSTVWRTKQVTFTSTSATTVIRFQAVADFGVTDIGLDNILVTDFADCAGVPSAGTAVANPAVVCGDPFTLSLQGASSAAGLTYQWQSGPSATGPWTNLANATNLTYTGTQPMTTWYRAVILCTLSGELAFSTPVQVVSPTPVSGVFTIDNSIPTNIAAGTFRTFNDAYNYIRCGINGSVVFNVVDNASNAAGVYNEQLVMTPIPGASALRTVTFRGRGATIAFSSSNTNERAVIKLRGADYIRFDSLIVNASAGTFGYGFHLLSNADSNIISNCTIITNGSATTTNYAGIAVNGTDANLTTLTGTGNCDFNEFVNNTISGGFAGIAFASTAASSNTFNRVYGNTIRDFHQFGVFMGVTVGTTVDSNFINRPNRTTVGAFTGIHVTGLSSALNISRNRISNPYGAVPTNTSAFIGIDVQNADPSTGFENYVVNNVIFNVNGEGPQTGISNTSSDNTYYLHNSIDLSDVTSASTQTTRGFFQTTLAGGLVYFNNNVTIGRGGAGTKHAIFMNTNTTGFFSDNNNFFITSSSGVNAIGFWTANRNTLADWQAATGQDLNAISRNPFYLNAASGNLTPTNGAVDNKGTGVNILVDALNTVRSTTTPDVGAFEFAALPCTQPVVPGNTLFDDTTVCQNGFVRLNLTLTSWGSAQTFQWQTATSAAGPWTNLGGLRNDPDTTIRAAVTMYYRAVVSCGASTATSNPLQLLVSPALPAGTYTINSTQATNYVAGNNFGNFASFNAAKAAMACGIVGNGDVIFNVVANTGPYNEQLILDSIPGVSISSTITFNGNGNTLAFSSTNSNERATLKLRGADYIRFDSLRIEGSAGTFGYGVQLIANADSNIFRRCTILSNTTSTSTNYAGVVINASESGPTTSGSTFTDGNLFENNTIIGGNTGIVLVGGTTVTTTVNDNQFVNNRIQDFYTQGMFVAGARNTLIRGNTFSRPARTTTASSVYGIWLTTPISYRTQITQNRFQRFFAAMRGNSASVFGVYHNNMDAPAGNETFVNNNLVFGMENNGPAYGFYNLGSDNVFYYHNTISLDNTANTATGQTAGFFQTTLATGLFFRNNIVTIQRGGTGPKHAVFMQTATTELTSNNNTFFVAGTNAHIGFQTTNLTTLAAWQSTRRDSLSFSQNPLYVDTAAGDFNPQLLAIDNRGVPLGITVDIENSTRSTTTPDMGAFEFTAAPCASVVTGTASVTPNTGVCLDAPIRLNIVGHSPLGSITFQWQSAPSATGPWTNVGPLQFFPTLDTVTTPNTFYRAIVSCGAQSDITNVVQVNLNSTPMQGLYTINSAQATGGRNYQTFQAAVTALSCGISGPVVFDVAAATYNERIQIRYIPGSSTTNTVTFQSATGVPSSVNLSFNADAASNYTLQLDSTRNFIFRNMTFTGTNAVAGRVIELRNTASNIRFENNTVTAPSVTTTGTAAAGIVAVAHTGRDLTFINNRITGGSAGISLAGGAIRNLLIDSNTVTGAFENGILVQLAPRLRLTNNTVNVQDTVALNAHGIRVNDGDSAYIVTGNVVNITNTGVTRTVFGMFINNSDSVRTTFSQLTSNRVTAGLNNRSSLTGIHIANSPGTRAVNNVVSIATTGANSYGLFSTGNANIIVWNNSVQSTATSATNNYAAYFVNTAAANLNIRNNIFSHRGGGRAFFATTTVGSLLSDYNMLFTTGTVLAQTGTPAATYNTLAAWRNNAYWDLNSIVFPPAFANTTDLRPDLADSDVWAMHGRGVQIATNNSDFSGNVRPVTLTQGVPDLGAYEFFPTVEPTLLQPIPATPAPNATQTFMFGTDTVMKITWGPTAPPSAGVRRFSGVVPTGLTTGMDSMFFYTRVDIPGGGAYSGYSTQLFYIDSWLGSIPDQNRLGLGKTTASNAWVVGASSRVDVPNRMISQSGLDFLNRFTGLINPFAPPVIPDRDSSNRGRRFWVAYPVNQLNAGTTQEMVIYLSAEQTANVQVRINGTNWVRNYFVPANTVRTTEFLPKAGVDNAFINAAGLSNRGISITSDVPIVAYAHVIGSTSSGAAMLLPVGVWGYEYKTLNTSQQWGSDAFSYYYVVADNDNTAIDITSVAGVPLQAQNSALAPGQPSRIILNKGEVYQVIAGNGTADLSGSVVRSVPNASGQCFPIAVFSGSSRTQLNGACTGSGGDFMMQQNFPATAWGKRYLTAPTSTSSNASVNESNIFRVAVRDPSTVVRRNGTIMTGLVNNQYYQYLSSTADLIESDKEVMVAQYMTGACGTGNVGDPEMIYISPVEQGINKVGFYRNNQQSITVNYLTMVIPTGGLPSLVITDGNTVVAPDLTYPHPQNALMGRNYTVVVKRWTSAQQQVRVSSDSAFTAITYGQGSVESYGYNAGTLVKTLRVNGTITNTLNPGGGINQFTCARAPFALSAYLPIRPDSIRFQFSTVPGITPSQDVVLINPTPSDSVVINGVMQYIFRPGQNYTFNQPGIYTIPVSYGHPSIEACNKTQQDAINIQVVPAPVADFTTTYSGCVGDAAQFTGVGTTANGVTVNSWQWTFNNNTTATGQNASFTYNAPGTYNESLQVITADGCVGETIKQVTVNARPVVNVVQDSLSACTGTNVTYAIQNPQTGVTYNWYSAATGGTLVFTGTSYTFAAANAQDLFIEAVNAANCSSTSRRRVRLTMLAPFTAPVVSVQSANANSVTFTWAPVAGASGYEVSTNGGATWTAVTAPPFTATGLGTLQQVTLTVRTLGTNTCQTSGNATASGCTNSAAVVSNPNQQVCPNTAVTFTIQAPVTGVTYNWFTTATGGTPVATGTSFTTPALTASATYWIEQTNGTCTSTTRTQVTGTVLPPLANPVVRVVTQEANSVTFGWDPVANASTYQVSIAGGPFVSPSGPGLTHTVGNLRPLDTVSIVVRAIGTIACQTGTSASLIGRSRPDDIFIPNAFSPNGDGLNDKLLVYGFTMKEMTFMVFNQFGEKIYEGRDLNNGWDGTYKGKPQPSGVYLYVVRFVLKDGTVVDRRGSINLIR